MADARRMVWAREAKNALTREPLSTLLDICAQKRAEIAQRSVHFYGCPVLMSIW
jgi:hypothetical protein